MIKIGRFCVWVDDILYLEDSASYRGGVFVGKTVIKLRTGDENLYSDLPMDDLLGIIAKAKGETK